VIPNFSIQQPNQTGITLATLCIAFLFPPRPSYASHLFLLLHFAGPGGGPRCRVVPLSHPMHLGSHLACSSVERSTRGTRPRGRGRSNPNSLPTASIGTRVCSLRLVEDPALSILAYPLLMIGTCCGMWRRRSLPPRRPPPFPGRRRYAPPPIAAPDGWLFVREESLCQVWNTVYRGEAFLGRLATPRRRARWVVCQCQLASVRGGGTRQDPCMPQFVHICPIKRVRVE